MLATPLAGPIRERMLRESAGLSADGALPGNANPTLLGRLAEETTGMQSDSNGAGLRARRTTRSRTRIVAGTLAAATAVGLSLGAMAPAQAAPPPKGVRPAASTSTSSRSTTSTGASSRPAPPPASPGSRAPSTRSVPTNPNTVFAAAGDLIGASTFTSFIQQDNPHDRRPQRSGPRRQLGRQPRVRQGLRRPDRPRDAAGRLGVPRRQRLRQGHDRPRAARVLDRRSSRA